MGKNFLKRKIPDYDEASEIFGIVNPYGQFWTHNTFDSETAALEYVLQFWSGDKVKAEEFTAIPVAMKLFDARPEIERTQMETDDAN